MPGVNVDPTAVVTIEPNTLVYLNDGLGTKVSPKTSEASLFVHKKPGSILQDDWNSFVTLDKIPPEKFSISLEKNPSIFSNKYFITFNTTDKQTGIDHYEVIEEPLDSFNFFSWGDSNAPWVVARSPYLLKDQSLNSTIRVKAIDKAGNTYVATFIPEDKLGSIFSSSSLWSIFIVAVSLVVILLLTSFYYFRKKIMYRRHNTDEFDKTDII